MNLTPSRFDSHDLKPQKIHPGSSTECGKREKERRREKERKRERKEARKRERGSEDEQATGPGFGINKS